MRGELLLGLVLVFGLLIDRVVDGADLDTETEERPPPPSAPIA